MKPRIQKIGPMKIVGCKTDITPSKDGFEKIRKVWETFFTLPPDIIQGVIKNECFWGVANSIDHISQSYIAGVQVSEFKDVPHKLTTIETQKGKYAIFEHQGNPKDVKSTAYLAMQWIWHSKHNLNGSIFLEMYDSRCECDDPEDCIIDIYIPII